ncbi:MAG: nitrous oxide-stimulated promoter family protein [Blastocatellia bacterium]
MTEVYCSGLHEGSHESAPRLCGSCQELLDYAFLRLSKCPFGETKPTCVKCVVHCYKAVMRERVKEMMRYSGPKMITRHPVLAVFHLIDRGLYKPRRKAKPGRCPEDRQERS